MLGEMSDCAITGSARVDVRPITGVGMGLAGEGRSEWSRPSTVGSKWLDSPVSVVGRKRRIAKTLPANLDLDFQKGIWVRRLQKQHWMWSQWREYEKEAMQLNAS